MCRPKGASAPPRSTNRAKPALFTDYLNQLRKSTTTTARKYLNNPKAARADVLQLLTDPGQLHITCYFLIIAEIILSIGIVQKVPYTEIDWRAYMQEVGGVLNGTWDYAQLRGDTGPLVYPAGFVYVYMALYYLTAAGTHIRIAQYVFVGLYIGQLVLSYRLLKLTAKVPPYAVLLAAAGSYRIHSIYMLRLFNDPIAVLLLYGSLNALLSNRWWACSLLYTLAVSIKMNILLYAPALLLAYLTCLPSIYHTLGHLTLCAVVQLILAAPFLILGNPWSYLRGAFDLGRVFEHRWTVNWRFLPVEWFEWKGFHLGLLVLHLILLGMFVPAMWKYMRSYSTLRSTISEIRATSKAVKKESKPVKVVEKNEEKLTKGQHKFLDGFEQKLKQQQQQQPIRKKNKQQTDDNIVSTVYLGKVTQLMVLPFYVCNLIGVACARSLHYQFYSWYYHSLLYLVYCTSYSRPAAFLLLGTIEYCWNVYPSTVLSSALLHICHILLIYQLYKYMRLNK